MTRPWLAVALDRVTHASAHQVTTFATLARTRDKLEAELARRITALGTLAERRDQPPAPQVHQRVLAAVRAQQVDALSVRDQRYAAKLFDQITAAQMQWLLAARPGNWKVFAIECFTRWDQLEQSPERAAYARLLSLAPPTAPFLHRFARPQDLVAADGPARLARSLQASDLVGLRDELARLGFEPRWMYTAATMAHWFAARTQQRDSFAHAWQALRRDVTVEAMMLPRLADTGASWFSVGLRPTRVRQSVTAQATFVAALVRAAYDAGVEDAQWAMFTEKLLRSAFGDPRIPPSSQGWQQVQQIDRASYDRLLQQLISEDIAVFFEHAMKDPRRQRFWLSYLPSLRRTTCIVDLKGKKELVAQLAGADARYMAALSRARTYRGTGVAAFCLYFDAIVVVEFAETGNAAQVYERGYFERQFERAVQANATRDHTELKTPPARASTPGVGPRIIHNAGWEAETEAILASYRIARAKR